jgi:hypothetical protein
MFFGRLNPKTPQKRWFSSVQVLCRSVGNPALPFRTQLATCAHGMVTVAQCAKAMQAAAGAAQDFRGPAGPGCY